MVLKLAYSPTLAMAESWVALYQIYVLKDPFSNEIFYVGQTINELKIRLSGHLSESRAINAAKRERIDEIVKSGYRPIIESVESIAGICYIDSLFVNDREIFWIKYYKSRGIKLTNIASAHSSAECKEFKTYLRSIKAGQGDYRYYYCGKTVGGHDVYDEKKMRADGFRLPNSDVRVIEKIVEVVVEKVVERPVYIYRDRPKVETIIFPEMPEQPQWTEGFRLQVPFPDVAEDFIEDEDDSDWEIDSDYEPEEDADDSDFEPDSDYEQEVY